MTGTPERGLATPPGAATVVVAADGPDTDALVAVLAGWARVGLVTPSWWVTPAGWHSADDPRLAPRVDAVHVGPGGVHTVELLPALAPLALDHLRVVAVHLLAHPGAGEPQTAAFARRVAELVARAAPRATTLERTTLLVPATGVTDVPADLLQAGWEANLVASPEDRIGDEHVDVLVHGGNLVTHAALEVASVGGLLGGATIPDADDAPGDGEPHPVVVRSQVRAVRVGQLLDRVLGHLQGGAPEPAVPAAMGATLVAATYPATVVDRAVLDTLTLARDDLLYRAPTPARPRPPQRLGPWATVKLMARLLGDLLRRMPDHWVDGLRTRVEGSIQRATFGEGTGLEVHAGTTTPPGAAPAAGLAAPPGRPWTLDELESAARPVPPPGPVSSDDDEVAA